MLDHDHSGSALDEIMVEVAFGEASDMGKADNTTLSWKDLTARLARPYRDRAHTIEQYAALDKAGKTDAKAEPGFIFCGHLDGGARNKASVQRRNLLTLDADNLSADDRMVKAILTGTDADLAAVGIDFPCAIHSTRSDTPGAPRFRIFSPVSRPMMPEEYEPLSRHVARGIDPEQADRFDKVSFTYSQMMFLASLSSDQGFFFREVRTGAVINVDAILSGPLRTYRTAKEQEKDSREAAKAAARANRAPTLRPACLGAVAKPKGSMGLAGTEDPRNRRGIVGAFCTVHGIHSAVSTYLTAVYEPYSADRYTYIAGSGSRGLVVYDGDLLCYSNHSTDPASVHGSPNAFDIVRIHKFGHMDAGSFAAHSGEQPSYAAMRDLARKDPRVRAEDDRRRKERKMNRPSTPEDFAIPAAAPSPSPSSDPSTADAREDAMLAALALDMDAFTTSATAAEPDPLAQIEAMTSPKAEPTVSLPAVLPPVEADPETETVEPDPVLTRNQVYDMLKKRKVGKNDETVSTDALNANLILRLDPVFRGKIRHNDLVAEPVVYGKIRHGIDYLAEISEPKNGDGLRLDDGIFGILRMAVSAPFESGGYGVSFPRDEFLDGLRGAAIANRYNPLIEEIESFAWDGVPRIDTFAIDNLGCPDDAYHREVSALLFLSALHRLYEPGSKMDHMFIFEGATNLGKSYLINSLAMGRSVETDAKDLSDSKKRMEMLAGSWLVEIPELSGFESLGYLSMKAMITMLKDRARLSYAQFAVDMPRSIVLIGTTNEWQFLTDPNGNRRYLVIKWRRKPDLYAIDAIVPQLWAEALVRYRSPEMMKELCLQSPEAINQAAIIQEGRRIVSYEEDIAAKIRDWLDEPHRSDSDDPSFGKYIDQKGNIVMLRDRFCLDQVWVSALSKPLADKKRRETVELSKAIATLPNITTGRGVMAFDDHPEGNDRRQRYYVVDRSDDVTHKKFW